MIDLKVATARAILNYAQMLEEHKYYEDAFKVCVMLVICSLCLWYCVLVCRLDSHANSLVCRCMKRVWRTLRSRPRWRSGLCT